MTPDELDEVLKGLTTFGDMDYGLVETADQVAKITPLTELKVVPSHSIAHTCNFIIVQVAIFAIRLGDLA